MLKVKNKIIVMKNSFEGSQIELTQLKISELENR